MKKIRLFLLGLLSVVVLGVILALSINSNASVNDTDELAITKGEKSVLAMKCGDEEDKEKCGEEKENKCGDECKDKEKKCGDEGEDDAGDEEDTDDAEE